MLSTQDLFDIQQLIHLYGHIPDEREFARLGELFTEDASNTVRFHRALRKAGIKADLHVFEAMPHGGFFGAPEDAESAEEQRQFIDVALAGEARPLYLRTTYE